VIKSVRTLLSGELNSALQKYRKEFDEIKSGSNNKRCELIVKALIPLNAILILIDLFVYRPMWDEVLSYKYLYYSHILAIIIFSLWLILLKFNRRYNWSIKESIFNTTIYYLVIIWCTFMGLNSTKINGQISAYIVCMFCFAVLFYITPIETFLTYGISLTIFTTVLIAIIDNPKLLYGNLVNVFITIILAIIGSIMNYSSFVKDFLNKKSLQENKLELELINQKLKEYEKLRTDFFANISHELRTPLNVIYSAKQMIDVSLKNSNFNDAKVNKYLKMVTQNSQRLLRLINNLIDITKIDGLSFEVKLSNSDIIKTVEDIVMSVADFIESKGITLTFDTEVEEKIIACDPDIIERIMLNLLSNAVKFTQDNGVILVSIFTENNSVCISVKDSGIGIPEEMQDLIFQRFIQVDKSLKRVREGSGIGLSLVKSLTEMHGGEVLVKSKLGEGTEFMISLPDKKLSEDENVPILPDLKEGHIDRINIEFSDIYS
jgi:two-component system, OmpR family, phosphate regulon sensor histidine kinase PhoR